MKQTLAGLVLLGLALLVLGIAWAWTATEIPLDQAPAFTEVASSPTMAITSTYTQTPTPAPTAKHKSLLPTWGVPTLTLTPVPIPTQVWAPERIRIPSIHLDAPIVPAQAITVKYQDQFYRQWVAPNIEAIGWITTSATLGVFGNTAFLGHDNGGSHVFEHLVDLKPDDRIVVISHGIEFVYWVDLSMKLPEFGQPLSVRQANAAWLGPFPDERITLVTCWPFWASTHRIVVVAKP